EVARSAVPVQPSENKARQVYQALVAGFGDRLIGIRARFELAEMFAEREEHGAAVKLLREALDAEALDALPGPELTDPIRIRLGCCLTARKEYEPALAQFDVVAGDPKSPLAAQAHYRAGECLLARGDAAGAAARFAVFRDRPEFQNVPGLTDRALLRLGHALAEAREWDASRQALEQLIGRFGSSPWVPEARYGIGWALQNQGRHDDAVSAYNQVIAATATRLAAKAHLQIGLCRLEQKRYAEAANALLVVPFTFDEPDLNAVALTEAARAFAANRQPEQAERLLRRVLRDEPPESERARAAPQRLGALTKE
ncbi:MAG TPA: tetratricopeptide repeat protein, partial [Gemmataceae bacterium]